MLFALLLANGINGFIESFDNMKTIKCNFCCWKVILNTGDKNWRHIYADVLDLF